MNVIVVGCGKVGSGLANLLSEQGYDVAVVEQDEDSFNRLDDDFAGVTITGVPIDIDVLKRAGIEICDVLVAVTQDDNVNLMVSQVAREFFKVPRVLARIYDPRRKGVFSQFGLQTVCPTTLTVDVIRSIIDDSTEDKRVVFDQSVVTFSTVTVLPKQVGLLTDELEFAEDEAFVGVLRPDGKVLLNRPDVPYVLEAGDKILYGRSAQ